MSVKKKGSMFKKCSKKFRFIGNNVFLRVMYNDLGMMGRWNHSKIEQLALFYFMQMKCFEDFYLKVSKPYNFWKATIVLFHSLF